MTGTDKQNDKSQITAPAPKYTQEDFFNSTTPYEEVYAYREDPFQMERKLSKMAKAAESVGIRNFKKLFAEYTNSLKRSSTEIYVENATNFQNQPLELDAGEWQANDLGVSRSSGPFGEEVACCHPIEPVERLVNIDTGIEKLKIAYSKGRKWRDAIVEKSVLASNQKILQLSDLGIAVTSENSRALVRYISDVENLNYDKIPEKQCVSRLGWIEGEGFSPYVDGLTFDGDTNFGTFFKSICSKGSNKEWLTIARCARKFSIITKIVLSASLSSVLVGPLGCLPFFLHLWGGTEAGKTVALMLATSVWANPEKGRYWFTFNSTNVGQEKTAAFFNSMPLMMDDFQLERVGNNKKTFDSIIYSLAEGVGRLRGTKTGGIDKIPTWSNCIITNGETPITSAGSGGGAVNRVVEIECTRKLFEDPQLVASSVRKNYGFAGKQFVQHLDEDSIKRAEAMYQSYYKEFSDGSSTEKQAMAAAAIITADQLATEWIFQDGQGLTVADISKFLTSRSSVSAGERGYHYMCDWVAQNSNKFSIDAKQGDIYGVIEDEMDGVLKTGRSIAYIINSTFRRAAEDAGFSATALLSYLRENDLILIRGRNNTRGKRINGVNTECVALKMPLIDDGFEEITPDDDLPFPI